MDRVGGEPDSIQDQGGDAPRTLSGVNARPNHVRKNVIPAQAGLTIQTLTNLEKY
jgi:hypothetical protein